VGLDLLQPLVDVLKRLHARIHCSLASQTPRVEMHLVVQRQETLRTLGSVMS
jgi:hypothetical protein